MRSITALIVVLMLDWCAHVAAEPLDLSRATVFSTLGTTSRQVIDGDETTIWTGGGGSLTENPANVFIRLAEPTAVGRLQVVTNDRKSYIRLTGLEVYAQVGEGWALLGAIDGSEPERFQRDPETVVDPAGNYHLVRFEMDLLPARVELLRLRITATARPDNAWPNIHELYLHAPEDGAELMALAAAPVSTEGPTESLYVRATTGMMTVAPEIDYDPQIGYLGYARSFMDTMLAEGTDTYGETHSPMLVSILLLDSHEHPGVVLPPIEGQRQGDRAHFGGNLQHDLPLLAAMEHMSALTGDETYAEAARAYLQFFLDSCAPTPTGLWPWGEHAHWDFYQEAPGHTTHEYLGAPALDFWEQAWEMNPEAVTAHASGLINHVVNLETFHFNRHADIMQPLAEPRPEGMDGLDFPRHGGFFLQTWAFAWRKTGDRRYLDWIEGLLDHQADTLIEEVGLLPGTSGPSGSPESPSVPSTLSCALSMLESVPLLAEAPMAAPETADRVDRMARGYVDAAMRRSTLAESAPSFTSPYGAGALAGSAMTYVHAYRLTGDQRALAVAQAVATKYAELPEIPRVRNIPAQVFGSIVNLMLDMHELDGDRRWLHAAERYAQTGIERLYCKGLFRGATDLWYYESELWVSNFVYALVRLHAVTAHTEHRVPYIAFQR